MQNFWWNRKFYHGKDLPDSFRLHRLEEGQKETNSALESLLKAQQALDELLSHHGTLLSEHTALLSDLTTIAEALQEEVQAITALYDDLDNELLVLVNNDSALSARIDGMEEACADTAAEQTTRLDGLEATATALFANLDSVSAETSKIATLEAENASLKRKVENLQVDKNMGAVLFTGEGANASAMGFSPASVLSVYGADGSATHRVIPFNTEVGFTLPSGNGAIYGLAEKLELKEGVLTRINLQGMTCLKTLHLRYGNFSNLMLSDVPHLTEVALEGVSSGTINLKNQTKIGGLILMDCSATIQLPETLPDLCFVHLSRSYATESFLDSLLPDRTGQLEGYIFLSGATPPSWLAERNWVVI